MKFFFFRSLNYLHSKPAGYKASKAFSLIELLLVVAIIGIVSSITIVSFGNSKNIKDVETAALAASGKFREAQTAALTGQQYTEDTIPCAYQVSWGNSEITNTYIYKDSSDNCIRSTTISSLTLPSGVNFKDDPGSVDFTLPHGETNSAKNITVQKGSVERTICVRNSGLIEVLEIC